MKNAKLPSFVAGLLSLALVGCEIVTDDQPAPPIQSANGIVINELFILPPPNPNSYYWIELYNPTNRQIDITKWTLGYKTRRNTFAISGFTQNFFIKAVFAVDTFLTYRDVRMFPIFQTDTTFLRNRPLPNPPDTLRKSSQLIIPPKAMAPNSFITYLNDETRMLNYTAWGPGGGEKVIPLIAPGFGSTMLEFQRDFYLTYIGLDSLGRDRVDSTVHLDSIIVTASTFFLQNADQLALKDSSGGVIDMLRYGGSDFQYPNPDNYSQNRALGPIVPYQSFARYAGAYKTGAYSNSAADFYVTSVQVPLTRPIPHWLSQAYKR